MATLIHEIGHGLGITHLGRGIDVYNTANEYEKAANDNSYILPDSLPKHEFMTVWFPSHNIEGITSSKEVAANLALSGLTYRKSRKLASWILTNQEATVTYTKDKKIISTIPFGVEIYFTGNYVNTIAIANTTATIDKNYNIYQFEDSSIVNKELV